MPGALYDRLGCGYDTTRRADPYLTSRLAALMRLGTTDRYLDVGCGTGNYTIALAGRGGGWTGVDRSMRMVMEARRKAATVGWSRADIARLPFAAGTFRDAVCVLAVHHFASAPGAMLEIARVIRERFVLFTGTREQMTHCWLAEYFPLAMARSIDQMPSRTELLDGFELAGLRIENVEPYAVDNNLVDMFLYSGKHRPWVYLDERVRAGISTFASLSDDAEMRAGVERLALDIQSGRIEDVQRRYDKADGDYSFIIGSK